MKKALCAIALLVTVMLLATCAALAEPLSRGSRGQAVVELQEKLNELGYSAGTADGDFGGKTESALMAYQQDNGLPVTGTLDEATSLSLYGFKPRYEYYVAQHGWQEAALRARAMGGYLVRIDSAQEYAEIQSEILELGLTDVSFWIGLRRDPNERLSPELFHLTDAMGCADADYYNFDEVFGDYDPWAIGEPSYYNANDERQNYAALRYSDSERRFVLANTTGNAEAGGTYGYIVEYDGRASLAALTDDVASTWQGLTVSQEGPWSAPGGGIIELIYNGNAAGMLYQCVIPDDQQWYVWVYVYSDDGSTRIGKGTAWLVSGDSPQAMRVNIELNDGASSAQVRTVKARVYREMKDTREQIGGVYLEKYGTINLNQQISATDGVMNNAALYRTAVVRAIDPTVRTDDASLEIRSQDGAAVYARCGYGQPVYLPQGEWRVVSEGEEQAAFTVPGDSAVITVDDMPRRTVAGTVCDGETGEVISNARVAVVAQGVAVITQADESGQFSVENIPAVETRVWAVNSNTVGGMRVAAARFDSLNLSEETMAVIMMELPHEEQVAFFGYVYDDTEYVNELIKNRNGWKMGIAYYMEDIEDIYHPEVYPGKIYTYGDDSFNEFDITSAQQVQSYHNALFKAKFDFDMLGTQSELLVITGYTHINQCEENNRHWDFVYPGPSDDIIGYGNLNLETPIQAYYHRLIRAIDQGKNAMDNTVFRAVLKKYYMDNGLSEARAEKLMATLDAAPAEWRDLYLLSLYYYNINVNKLHGSFTSWYSGSDNTLNFEIETKDSKFLVDFFHESGHAAQRAPVDYYMTHSQAKPGEMAALTAIDNLCYKTITNALVEDVRQLIRDTIINAGGKLYTAEQREAIVDALVNGDAQEYHYWFGQKNVPIRKVHESVRNDAELSTLYEATREIIEDAVNSSIGLKDPASNADMLWDIIGGVTNNKMAGMSRDIWGSNGHNSIVYDSNGNPSGYWYRYDAAAGTFTNDIYYNVMREAWAEYFSARINSLDERNQANTQFFPTGTALMDQLRDELTAYYLDYYRKDYGDYSNLID